MLFRFFSFCIVMTLASTLTYGQQANGDTKKTFDNYDVILAQDGDREGNFQ